MSAAGPQPASDADHPLHSILSGFSEVDDDVLADFERDDDATVEPGPPRRPSSGRPLDDGGAEPPPFTPPVPAPPVDRLHYHYKTRTALTEPRSSTRPISRGARRPTRTTA